MKMNGKCFQDELEEDAIAKQEREIIESLEKEEQERKNRQGNFHFFENQKKAITNKIGQFSWIAISQ